MHFFKGMQQRVQLIKFKIVIFSKYIVAFDDIHFHYVKETRLSTLFERSSKLLLIFCEILHLNTLHVHNVARLNTLAVWKTIKF